MAECMKRDECIGFFDPMVVVKYCVFLLSRDVYPNMALTKFDVECTKAKPKEPCDGIKLYLEKLDIDPVILQGNCNDELNINLKCLMFRSKVLYKSSM